MISPISVRQIFATYEHNMSPCKLSEQNFTIRGRFSKNQKMLTKFPGQAVITLQLLQITPNSLPNGLSTKCIVSIFTVRIFTVFPLVYMLSTRKDPSPNFFLNPYCIVTIACSQLPSTIESRDMSHRM